MSIVEAPSVSPPRRLALQLIVAGAFAWFFGLAAMAWFTANPEALSQDQLRYADEIVLGRRVAEGRDRLKIERVLSGKLTPETEVTVLNLNDVPKMSVGVTYLVPLTYFRQDYRVTTLEKQQAPPLIYPATPRMIDDAKHVLVDGIRGRRE